MKRRKKVENSAVETNVQGPSSSEKWEEKGGTVEWVEE